MVYIDWATHALHEIKTKAYYLKLKHQNSKIIFFESLIAIH